MKRPMSPEMLAILGLLTPDEYIAEVDRLDPHKEVSIERKASIRETQLEIWRTTRAHERKKAT